MNTIHDRRLRRGAELEPGHGLTVLIRGQSV